MVNAMIICVTTLLVFITAISACLPGPKFLDMFFVFCIIIICISHLTLVLYFVFYHAIFQVCACSLIAKTFSNSQFHYCVATPSGVVYSSPPAFSIYVNCILHPNLWLLYVLSYRCSHSKCI